MPFKEPNTDSVEDGTKYTVTSSIIYKEPAYKSVLIVSDRFRVMSLKHYNWFQKLMWKFLLNVEIIDIKENNNNKELH